jgi:hypothetical protein
MRSVEDPEDRYARLKDRAGLDKNEEKKTFGQKHTSRNFEASS